VETITKAIASIHERTMTPTAMEMEDDNGKQSETSNGPHNPHPNQLDLPTIINDLKTEIATINTEMKAMLCHLLPPKLANTTPSSSVT